jgi:hypothetical protein
MITVDEAVQSLEARGLIEREPKDQAERVIGYVSGLIGRPIPADLAAFYRARIKWLGDFTTITIVWNQRVGWLTHHSWIEKLLPAKAIPIFDDGCGSLFGVDVSEITDHPAVYFFDHESEYKIPNYAAGSSIGAFLLLLAEHGAALEQKRPHGWELAIDPDLDKCSRAPPIWLAD